jgi:hypothetical protein
MATQKLERIDSALAVELDKWYSNIKFYPTHEIVPRFCIILNVFGNEWAFSVSKKKVYLIALMTDFLIDQTILHTQIRQYDKIRQMIVVKFEQYADHDRCTIIRDELNQLVKIYS